MNRSLFAAWGAGLSQEDFAKAVGAVAVLGLHSDALDSAVINETAEVVASGGHDIVELRLANLAELAAAIEAKSADLHAAQAYLLAWESFYARLVGFRALSEQATTTLRIEIDPALPGMRHDSAFDLAWLNSLLLGSGSLRASSAYLRVDEPDRPIAWEWPLRVGLLGDARSLDLAGQLTALPWPDLVRLVSLDVADECDLLLLPDGLRSGLARVLLRPRRLHADCVLLIGGAGVAAERVMPLVATMRQEVLTAGVGIAHIDSDRQGQWFNALIENLSHDLPIDVALLRSVQAAQAVAEPPLLIASRRLVVNARVAAYSRRLGQQLRRIAAQPTQGARGAAERAVRGPVTRAAAVPAPVIADLADEFEAATRGPWLRDVGAASVLANLRSVAEAELGAPLGTPRAGVNPAEPKTHEQRHVNFTVVDLGDTAAPTPVHDRLETDHAYQLALDIGLPRTQAESASEAFPSERLPPSDRGHWLEAFFVPLVRARTGRWHTPQQARLFLPSDGDSDACLFTFRTHGVEDQYRARILITHENRVIQTLIFSSPLGDAAGRFALTVENVVAPTFDPAWRSQAFDAAIVVNHGSDGQAGFTTVVGQAVSFREPVGIDKLVGEVKLLLSAEATFPAARAGLDDPALLKLFDDLARYGRAILKAMPEELQGRVPEGARIQIVEARAGAWLPVEILYGSLLPKAGAQLCPNVRAALLCENGGTHERCEHRDDRNFHCPMRFWGFSCIIERQPSLAPTTAADYTISVPQPGANRLDAFRSVLVGASSKVRAQDLSDPGGVIDAVCRVAGSARMVKDWDEWESAVATDSPSLLLLMPHSQEDPAHPGITGLEIGGVLLTYPELESNYVADAAAAAPVVLLLGCSTQLTEVPFLNFVEAFKRERAALVIGTLATIRGRRAVTFVGDLLDGLKAAAGSERTFGEVFLEAKRKLLASGDGFVLSLTAYGDVGWRL